MIIGFDSDDAAIFEDQYIFLQEAGIPIVMLGLLQAIPRTPLYERLERTGRLRNPAQGNNTLSFTNIEPVCMRYDELVHGYRTLFTRLYTLDAIGDRWLANVEAWSTYVFSSGAGTPLEPGNVRHAWYQMLEAAELDDRPIHTMRHTHSSLLIAAGENPSWVAAQAGRSLTETMKT